MGKWPRLSGFSYADESINPRWFEKRTSINQQSKRLKNAWLMRRFFVFLSRFKNAPFETANDRDEAGQNRLNASWSLTSQFDKKVAVSALRPLICHSSVALIMFFWDSNLRWQKAEVLIIPRLSVKNAFVYCFIYKFPLAGFAGRPAFSNLRPEFAAWFPDNDPRPEKRTRRNHTVRNLNSAARNRNGRGLRLLISVGQSVKQSKLQIISAGSRSWTVSQSALISKTGRLRLNGENEKKY